MIAMTTLPDFTTFAFTHAGRERTIYRKGDGPAVLIMHEVPGISAEVVRFARRVADAGFTVFMPRLFGPVGVKTTPFNRVAELLRICISCEFHVLAENRSSPITGGLRFAEMAYLSEGADPRGGWPWSCAVSAAGARSRSRTG